MNNEQFDKTHILHSIRLTIYTNGGETARTFNLYREPAFKDDNDLTSRCGRVTVARCDMPNQYRVFVNGKPVPENQYGIRHSIRDSSARRTSCHKKTLGRATNPNA